MSIENPSEPVQPTLAPSNAEVTAEVAVPRLAAAPLAEPAPEDGLANAQTAVGGRLATQVSAGTTDLSPARCAALLAERFPALFAQDAPPKPVKLRIQVDIQQRAPGIFTRKALSIFLHRHTTSTAYLKALVGAAHRFDLDGQSAGDIDEGHREAAREELARRRALMAARHAAQRSAQQPPTLRPDAGGEPHPHPPSGMPSGSDRARLPRRPPRRASAERPAERRPRREGPDQRDVRDGRQAMGPRALPPRPPVPVPGPGPRPHAADPGRSVDGADVGRRERAQMLRTWETSSLSKANFCVLKRMSEAEFDALIEQAKHERDALAVRSHA